MGRTTPGFRFHERSYCGRSTNPYPAALSSFGITHAPQQISEQARICLMRGRGIPRQVNG
jgi:hypothetical protein